MSLKRVIIEKGIRKHISSNKVWYTFTITMKGKLYYKKFEHLINAQSYKNRFSEDVPKCKVCNKDITHNGRICFDCNNDSHRRIEYNIYKPLNSQNYIVVISSNGVKYSDSFSDIIQAREFRDGKIKGRPKCLICNQLVFCEGTICTLCRGKSNLPLSWTSSLSSRLTIEEDVRKSKDGFIESRCYKCKKYFIPSYIQITSRVAAIEGKQSTSSLNIYCSQHCKDTCSVFGRVSKPRIIDSSIKCKQEEARVNQYHSKQDIIKEQLREFGYIYCERCGKQYEQLQLHHTELVSNNYDNPDLTINPNGHMLNCKTCHKLIHMACK